jgi:hypothetical protein
MLVAIVQGHSLSVDMDDLNSNNKEFILKCLNLFSADSFNREIVCCLVIMRKYVKLKL